MNRRVALAFHGQRRSDLSTMRMSLWRFTCLTNAFSDKVKNHEAAVALHFMCYNFARVHMSLRVTPAMEAGISDHIRSLQEIVRLSKINLRYGPTRAFPF